MKLLQKEYYGILERTQRGDGDITDWILWFLNCFEKHWIRPKMHCHQSLGKLISGNATGMFRILW